MTTAQTVEFVAKAIRATVAKRIGSDATPWEKLEEYHRNAYRDEARTAIEALAECLHEARVADEVIAAR